MSENQVKENLRELRYYYSRKASVESFFSVTGTTNIKAIARMYEAAIRTAPIRLYDLFGCLYIDGKTQEEVATELCYSTEYIRQLTKELVHYLAGQIK